MKTMLTVGGVIASVIIGAPLAAADDFTTVSNLSVAPGLSWGPNGSFGTNCTHVLSASSTYPQENMIFLDLADGLIASVPVVNGTAIATWTPRTPGPHTIMAYQTSQGGPQISIDVGTGLALGPACLVLP